MIDYISLKTDRVVKNFSLSFTQIIEFKTPWISNLGSDIFKNQKIFYNILSKILTRWLAKLA